MEEKKKYTFEGKYDPKDMAYSSAVGTLVAIQRLCERQIKRYEDVTGDFLHTDLIIPNTDYLTLR